MQKTKQSSFLRKRLRLSAGVRSTVPGRANILDRKNCDACPSDVNEYRLFLHEKKPGRIKRPYTEGMRIYWQIATSLLDSIPPEASIEHSEVDDPESR